MYERLDNFKYCNCFCALNINYIKRVIFRFSEGIFHVTYLALLFHFSGNGLIGGIVCMLTFIIWIIGLKIATPYSYLQLIKITAIMFFESMSQTSLSNFNCKQTILKKWNYNTIYYLFKIVTFILGIILIIILYIR